MEQDSQQESAHHGVKGIVLTAVALLIIIGAFATWQSKPLLRWVKAQIALRHVDEIHAAIENEAWIDAQELTRKTYALAPNQPEVLRAAARLALLNQSQEVFFFLDRLVALEEDTLDDRNMLCEAHLSFNDLSRAEELNNRVLKEDPQNHEALSIAVRIDLVKKDYPAAISHLVTLLHAHKDDVDHKLLLAETLIERGDTSDRELGWRYLWELASNPGPVGIKAIDRIAAEPDLIKPYQKKLVTSIKNHPLAEETHRIMALDLQVALYPLQSDRLISEAMAERAHLSPHEAADFFRWLSNQREYDRILSTLTLEKARQSNRLMPVYLNALGHCGRWREVKQLLEDRRVPMPETRRFIFAAHCANKLGEGDLAVQEHLQKALRAAKRNSSFAEALNTAKYAEEFGMLDEALLAFSLAASSEAFADEAYLGMLRIAKKKKDSFKMHQIADTYQRRFPLRQDLRERYLYLNVLIGVEIESSLQEALERVEAEPFRAPPRMIAALGLYRMNHFAAAAETCKQCRVEELSPSYQAVFAAIAGKIRQDDLSKKITRNLPVNSLLDEEKRLVAPWLTPPGDS